MKNIVFFVVLMLVAGCHYLEEPETLLRDPHYTAYKERLDALESQRLKGEITYAQYLEKKKQADDNYTREVQERTQKIEGQ